MPIVDELVGLLGWKLQGEQNLKRFESGMDRAAKRAVTFGGRLKALTASASTFATVAGGLAAAAGAALPAVFARKVLDIGGSFESLKAQMKTAFEGNEEAAAKAFGKIEQFARTTPYSLQGVSEAFVRLKSYGIDPFAEGTLQVLGDTASAMGKPIMQAVEAIADAQTGEFERLKEFGIKASKDHGKVTMRWTQDGKQMTKVVNETSDAIRKGLFEIWGPRFQGAMIEQSKTWRGLLSNLGDSWEMFLNRIFESGFGDFAKGQLKTLLDWLDRNDEAIGKAATKISQTFVNIGKSSAEWVGIIIKNWEMVKPVLAAMGIAFAGLWIAISPVSAAIVGVAAAIGILIKKFGDLQKTKEMMQAPSGEWVMRPPELQTDWGTVITDWVTASIDKWTFGVKQLGERLAGLIEAEGMGGFTKGIEEWSSDSNMGRLTASVKRFFDSLYEAMMRVVREIEWRDVAQFIGNRINEALGGSLPGFITKPLGILGESKTDPYRYQNRPVKKATSRPPGEKTYRGVGASGGWEEPELPGGGGESLDLSDRPIGTEPDVQPGNAPVSSAPSLFPAEPTIQTNGKPLSSNAPAKFQPPPAWSMMRSNRSTGGSVVNNFGDVNLNQNVAQATEAPGEAARATIDAIMKQMRDMPARVTAQIG